MKLIEYLYFSLILFGFCCYAQANDSDPVSPKEVEELANNVFDKSIPEVNSADIPNAANKPIESTEVDNKSEPEQPKGPAVGYVPEAAIERYQKNNRDKLNNLNIEQLKAEIYQYEKNQDFEQAIELLYELNTKAPDNDSTIQLTRLLIQTGKLKQAEIEIEGLCHSSNAPWQSCFLLGTAQLMRNQLEQAAQSFDRALLSDVEQSIVWLNRAIVEQERNDHHSAIQLLSVAKNINPDNANIILNLAVSHEALGNNELAFGFYKQFLQLTKNSINHEALRFSVLSHLSTLQIANQ